MGFSGRLKQARENRELSRDQLADLLGVTNSAISNYENGISSPKEEILLKIFDVLKVEPNFLFQDDYTNPRADLSQEEKELFEIYRKAKSSDKAGVKALIEAVDKLLGEK